MGFDSLNGSKAEKIVRRITEKSCVTDSRMKMEEKVFDLFFDFLLVIENAMSCVRIIADKITMKFNPSVKFRKRTTM